MEDPSQTSGSNTTDDKGVIPLPNATVVMTLGILSIVFSVWYFSILGVILSIIAIAMANREQALYGNHPGTYTFASFQQVRTGRICAITGLLIAILFFALMLLLVFGILATIPFLNMID